MRRKIKAAVERCLSPVSTTKEPDERRRIPATPEAAKGRILLVEDDPGMQDLLEYSLKRRGYAVRITDRGRKGIRLAAEEHPDLVILDLGLPDMDGLEVCRTLKLDVQTRSLPVLILSSRTSTQAQLLALEYSADHFLSKPIKDFEEFHRWVMALLRRGSHIPDSKDILRIGNVLAINIAEHEVTADERAVTDLPDILFRLLCELARHAGELLTRRYLVRHIWKNSVKDHDVDVAVDRLRKRLRDTTGKRIECVRGEGFRLQVPVSTGP